MSLVGQLLPLLSNATISGQLMVYSADGTTVGSLLYPYSPTEFTAGIQQQNINFLYQYGDVRRYGASSGVNIAPFVTTAAASNNLVTIPPGNFPETSNPTVPTPVTVMTLGANNPVSYPLMRVDNLFEATPSNFRLQNEGAAWGTNSYSFFGINKEFTNTTVPGQGASGPLTTLFAFASNNAATANVVAVIGDAVAKTANTSVFGANFIARNESVNGCTLRGIEIDVEPAAGTTISNQSIGLIFNMFSIASPATVCQVGSVSNGTWANGFITAFITGTHFGVQAGNPTTSVSFIDTTQGTFSSAAIKLGTTASQGINFGGSVFGTSPYIYGDSLGDFIVAMGSGGFVEFLDGGGTQRFTFDHLGGLNMPNGGVIKINSVQVLASQITGYGTPTNAGRISNFPGSSATLAQCGQQISQLIIDLKTHGLLGA